MLRSIFRSSIAVLMLVFFLYNQQTANAQIAPTNSATISGSLSDVAGKPVAGATVSLNGGKSASTKTDGQGLFVFVGIPLGQYELSAIASGLGTVSRTVQVQGDTNVAIQYEPLSVNGLKTIASVNASANARFNVTPASITQVNPMQEAFQGKTSWRTILEQIPGVAQAGLGSGNSPFGSIPDGPSVPVQFSIDGALPYETATLLDGMPLIGQGYTACPGGNLAVQGAGGGTDLSVYPLNGFDSADVVRGPGANSPSIVNSIGGSLVLGIPGAVSHNHYDLSLSTDPYGGIVANAQAAVRWEKLSVVATYGVNDSPGPLRGASIPAITDLPPSAIDGHQFICTASCSNFVTNPAYSGFTLVGFQSGLLICCADQSTAWTQHNGSIALNYAVSPSVNAEIFYGASSYWQSYPGQYYPVAFTPPAGYSGPLPAGEHVFFLNTPGELDLANYFGEEQASSLFEEKITAQVGHGVLRLAALQNRNYSTESGYQTASSANVQLFGGGAYCNDPGCSSTTPVFFNGETHTITFPCVFGSDPKQFQTNSRDMLLSYATPLGENVHTGASYVTSYYNSPYTSSSTIIPSAISQTTNELRVYVGGNPSQKTSLDLSMYFVNLNYHVPDPNNTAPYYLRGAAIAYSDARFAYAAPRAGFVWRPQPAIAVRAAAGGGFAEAPLNALIGSGTINPPFPPFTTYYSQTPPNFDLQPEKSFAFTLGADVRLHGNTTLSLDVYNAILHGQIYDYSYLSTSNYLGTGFPLYTQTKGNLGVSRYTGVLLNVHHDVPHGVYWALSGGLTRGYVVSVPSNFYGGVNACTNCNNLTVVQNINFNGTFTGAAIPYSQGLGILGYRWNPDKYIGLTATYFGNNNTYFRPAFVELDGNLGYPLTRNVALLVSFRNITGIYDSPVQTISNAGLSGAPVVSGLPSPLYGEEYGPRTVIVTTRFSL